MKQILALTLVVGLIAPAALAEDAPETDMGEGLSLMDEGARLLLRGLIDEMAPAMDAMRDNLDELGPAFSEFA